LTTARKKSGPWPIVLGGVKLSIITDGTHPDTKQLLGYSGSFEAQESTNQITRRDVPKVFGRFSRGSGFVRRRDADDDNGYAWAENMIMWFGEGPVPAGRMMPYPLTTVAADNGKGSLPILNGQIVQMIEFLGHLWLIFDKPAIIRIPNANPTQTPTYDPPINNGTYGTALTSLGIGNDGRCAEVFSTPGGAQALYVGTDNSGVGRVYEITAAGAITAGSANFTTVTTYSASKMGKVWWADRTTNSGANRLLLKTAVNEIRHCVEGSDPKLQNSYVTPIKVGTVDEEIQAIVGSDLHAYAVTNGGIKDFNELRVRNLTKYWASMQGLIKQSASVARGLPALLFNDHIIASRGWGSIDSYPVIQDGYQQRIVGECSPMAFSQDGTPIQGYFTAFCESGDGAILAGLYNPDNRTSYVGYAIQRAGTGIPGDGQLIWHWAPLVIPPESTLAYQVTALHVAAPVLSAGSTLASPKLYLWVALYSVGGGQALLRYVEWPVGSGPLSIRASSGAPMTHASSAVNAIIPQQCRVYLTGQQYDDANSLKAVRRIDVQHQAVSSTATIGVYVRADGDPATLTTDNTWTLEGTAQALAPDTILKTNIVPATVTTGQMIYTRLDFVTPIPFTAPPRLQEVRLRCNVRFEVFDVRYLNVVLQRDYQILSGGRDIRDPDEDWATVVGFQNTGPIAFVDETGASFQALVEQTIRYTRGEVPKTNGTSDWRTIARLEVSLVKAN
jgi:hypothetical protein